jgi:ribokinase
LTLSEALAPLGDAVSGDLVVLQGNLSEDVTRGILAEARHRGLKTAFNPSPLRPYFAELWPLIDVAFLNRGEAESLTGSSGEAAIRRLAEAGVSQTVLTLGGSGAILASGHEVLATVPARATEVVDTTGAGDTFMAVALASAALRSTALDAKAIHHATAAAAITVSRRGTRSAFPSRAELAGILAGE